MLATLVDTGDGVIGDFRDRAEFARSARRCVAHCYVAQVLGETRRWFRFSWLDAFLLSQTGTDSTDMAM